ncbi:MAG: replicative DNA helicase, partial [Gammaproteobacteria bacterium]|nr:replicative DNA helicase [Gammaproteobacteria bacterium]
PLSTPSFSRNQLPHNQLAEEEVLSSVMREQSLWDLIAGDLKAADFFDVRHALIFECIEGLAVEGRKYGLAEVGLQLQNLNKLHLAGGVEYLEQLSFSSNLNLSSSIQSSVEEIRNKSLLRKVFDESNRICTLIQKSLTRETDEVLTEVEERITNLTQTTNYDLDRIGMDQHLREVVEELDYIEQHNQARRGVQTGYIGLDAKTNGFLKSSLNIIAARPGVGKTAMAINLAEKLMMNEDATPILFFSMEQPAQELLVRLISSLSNVDQGKMTRQRLDEQEKRQVNSSITLLRSEEWHQRLLIDDRSSLSVTDIRKQARAVLRESGKVGLIVVDYLQLMQSSVQNREDSRTRELARITAGLKGLARDFNIPVIALSQLNRESEGRTDKRPRLADLRDSGAIEQDADVVMMLHRPDIALAKAQPDGEAELIIAKNRHGSLGVVPLKFTGALTRFESIYDPSRSSESSDSDYADDVESEEISEDPPI